MNNGDYFANVLKGRRVKSVFSFTDLVSGGKIMIFFQTVYGLHMACSYSLLLTDFCVKEL